VEFVPSILDVLDLEYIEENLYRGRAVFEESRRLYGGQVAAQALYAAGRTVPAERLPHSLHGYFLREGSRRRPTVFRVDRDRDGHSFSARRVVAIQDGEVIFNMSASFAAPQAGADRDAAAPELPAPDRLPRWSLPRHPSFELRTAGAERRLPVRFWLRSLVELPADPLLHAAVLAYTSDLSTGLVALEDDETEAGPSLDHAVWFHRPARMDGWTWHELEPHAVSGGRGWYTGAIYAADGSRIASFAQEQLFRTLRPVRPEPSFGTSG
jgi:acyl-CoA thioesterase II